jgi:hypothetical protein
VTEADAPVHSPYTFSECCESAPSSGAFLSLCVPTGVIADEQESMLDANTCVEPDNLCIPKPVATDPSGYLPDKCASWGGSEGRCLPACLPEVAGRADLLNRGICVEPGCDCENEGYLCVPCYEPVIGADGQPIDTGACRVTPADAPVDPPYTFPLCCDQNGIFRGVCVPGELAGEQAAGLAYDPLCAPLGSEIFGIVCAPIESARDPNYNAYPPCRNDLAIELLFGRGASCMADCFQNVIDLDDLLQVSPCAQEEECIPCSLSHACP